MLDDVNQLHMLLLLDWMNNVNGYAASLVATLEKMGRVWATSRVVDLGVEVPPWV